MHQQACRHDSDHPTGSRSLNRRGLRLPIDVRRPSGLGLPLDRLEKRRRRGFAPYRARRPTHPVQGAQSGASRQSSEAPAPPCGIRVRRSPLRRDLPTVRYRAGWRCRVQRGGDPGATRSMVQVLSRMMGGAARRVILMSVSSSSVEFSTVISSMIATSFCAEAKFTRRNA